MLEPVKRETCVDEDLLVKAEDIIDNFPKITGDFYYDIEIYRANSKVLNELLYQRNLPYDTSDIDISKYKEGGTFLVVRLNQRVEKTLDTLIKLQGDYLDKILGKN